MEAWLREVDEGLLFAVFFALLLASAELGFRIGRRVHPGQAGGSEASAVQGAVLGLLALLLGFTFSLAISRFEARKELYRDEANAIGTTYLRARLLPDPYAARVQGLLRDYVETRFELYRASYRSSQLGDVQARASKLHGELWDQAVAAAHVDSGSEMIALFVESLNDTIDMHGKRMAAIRNHIPAWIFVMLFLVALTSLGLTGYASGPSHPQSLVLNGLIALSIAMVTLLIFDLHRPARGFIRVETTSLEEVRESMRGR